MKTGEPVILLKKMLFSTRTMTLLLMLSGISMVVATFVENEFDTATAQALVYHAKWFEFLMLWLIILFTANIKTYRLTKREKWPVLVFHLAFIFMFAGGAVTRYFGFEGQMPIEEGSVTNEIISDLTYVKLDVSDGTQTLRYEKYPYLMSHFNAKATNWPFKRTFEQDYRFENKVISLRSLDYIPLARDSIQVTVSGRKMLTIVSADERGAAAHYLAEGEIKNISGILFSFNKAVQGAVRLMEKEGVIRISLPVDGHYKSMAGQQAGVVTDSTLLARQSGSVKADTFVTLNHRALYRMDKAVFIIPNGVYRGKTVYYRGDKNDPEDANLPDVVQLEITSGNERDTLFVRGGKGVTALSKTIRINGLNVSLGFGSRISYTDFYLRCDDFQLDRYPGSNTPSSYESTITVIDKGAQDQHKISMNNVMDYRGYRFFQASYFPDESGTVLSVNADRWGSNITYFGYFLLFSGMFFTLFWKGTRFWKLNASLKKMHQKRYVFPCLLLFLTTAPGITPGLAQTRTAATEDTLPGAQRIPGPATWFAKPGNPGRIIDPDHARKFGHLLVQDFQGRIKPMNTHTLELLRKISKKDRYRKGRFSLSSDQWFISMQVDPGYWADKPLINVSKKGGDKLMEETGANKEGYTSYASLVDPGTGRYKLEEQANKSFSRRKADQSSYDKAVIALTERFNIFTHIAFGYYTTVIPVKNDPAQTWRSWIYASEEKPVEIDTTAYAILTGYFTGVRKGLTTGNWGQADKVTAYIDNFQQEWGKAVVPSASKVKLEILYNQLNAFLWLMIVYSFLGVLLIILGFADVFSSGTEYNGLIRLLTKTLLGILFLALAIHTAALGVRWYISGHAPWSNGYEAIIFISGTGVLAGLLLYRNRNAFIPAAGALVAMVMMGFAHGGALLDPQITPLEPVLKSYWLMVHVGIITSSYGFFGLSAVLSAITLLLFSIKPTKKTAHSIKEMTLVNEMALTIGIFALATGTFLGGMWANESWGRYWSWDPKETWAFISVIVYAVVLHLNLVPTLRKKLTFNLASLWAIWTIIFTYFGVNYYLSGLHSYAAGDPIPVPTWIYGTLLGMLTLSLTACLGNKRNKKQQQLNTRRAKPMTREEIAL